MVYLYASVAGIVYSIGTILYYKHIFDHLVTDADVAYLKENKNLFILSVTGGVFGGLATFTGAAP